LGRPKALLVQLHTRHLRTYCAALRINAPEGCQRGTHTNGTAYSLPTHEVLVLRLYVIESTHTNTQQSTQTEAQTHTQATARPEKVRWRAGSRHAVAAPPSSEEGASPPPPASCISVAISPTPKLCAAAPPPKGAVPAARATSTSTSAGQLISFSYCYVLPLG